MALVRVGDFAVDYQSTTDRAGIPPEGVVEKVLAAGHICTARRIIVVHRGGKSCHVTNSNYEAETALRYRL